MTIRDIIIAIAIIIIWGINFIVIKMGLQNMPPLLLASLRFLAATIPAIFFLPRPKLKWTRLIALGMTLDVGQFAFLFIGIKLGMSAGMASLVIQTQVFFTLVMATLILKERFYLNNLIGIILSISGVVIIGFFQGSNISVVGFLLTLAAAFSWGIGNIIMCKCTNKDEPFTMLSLVVWASAVAIIPLTLLSWFIEGPASWKAAWHSLNTTSLFSIVYLAYLATIFAYSMWGKLLSKYSATVVSPFALLVPVVGMSSSFLLLGDHFSFLQILGAALVMIGLLINLLGTKLFKKTKIA
ncbi:EamA family transporter [Clostridium felsineum]|uniref:Amino-acid metabolite efflux pump n=1 Tax=Clostridium felsineum TaxID=36839 RepID=A0A1S8KZG2_9CLOT|nr:EamA family transporter [Clostridium felsineum]MCR3761608.1 EamA family transporter [Clostridium felsineum]URZ08337.1 putative amino-acid metabolite efflux pump [Clostridium felsineum]URZ13368.1 putative amino-acid metabolite efflux pump [Clostridium felsineum]